MLTLEGFPIALELLEIFSYLNNSRRKNIRNDIDKNYL